MRNLFVAILSILVMMGSFGASQAFLMDAEVIDFETKEVVTLSSFRERQSVSSQGALIASSYSYFCDSYDDGRADGVASEINSGINVAVGPTFSGTDGQFTYFLGHSPGSMGPVADLYIGAVVTITDAAGNAFDYTVYDCADTVYYPTFSGGTPVADPFHYGLYFEGIAIQYCINGIGTVFLAS